MNSLEDPTKSKQERASFRFYLDSITCFLASYKYLFQVTEILPSPRVLKYCMKKKNYFLIFIHSGNQVKIIPKMEKCKSKITFPYRQGIEKKNQFW